MDESKQAKARYKIKNWPAYNKALRQRGSVTVWLSDDARQGWLTQPSGEAKAGRGHPPVYSDGAIEAALTLGSVFGLPLRGTQGFVDSLLGLMRSDLSCPDYTTLSRRRGALDVRIKASKSAEPLVIAIDSTGLKVYGEGEWKVRQHKASKRRTWCKLHLAVDVKTHEIVATLLTDNSVADCEAMPDLIKQVQQPIAAVSADGAYDTTGCYNALAGIKAKPLIPPRTGAALQCPHIITADYNPALAPRDAAIRRIAALGGTDDARSAWKKEVGYHERSLAETAMFRRKTLFSPKLSARKLTNQKQESALIINAMNTMTRLGMPVSYKVPA